MKKVLLMFLIVVGLTVGAEAQGVKYVQLKREPVAYSPKAFYLKEVVDDRADKSGIGNMTDGTKKDKVSLQDGAVNYVSSFINANVKQNVNTQPIIVHITKTDVDIKKNGSIWNVNATIGFAYYAGDKKLVEYTGKGHGEMDTDPLEYTENFLRQTLENNMKKFETWWADNKDKIALAPTVKVNVVIGKTSNSKPVWIMYSFQRPLQITDFTGPVEMSVPEMAATSSGIALSYASRVEKGQVVLDVTLTPYFDKTQSWFKEAGKNPQVLAHEQTHFDITALKACKLAATIRNTTFTQDNYVDLVQQLQAENTKETNQEEDLYDTETAHGTIRDKQLGWEKRIKDELKAAGCY